MSEILESLKELLSHPYAWAFEVFVVVFINLLLGYSVKLFLGHLKKKAKGTKTIWDYAFLDAAHYPIVGTIWLIGLVLAANMVADHADASIRDVTSKIREVGIILMGAWFLLRTIVRVEHGISDPNIKEDPVDKTTARAISKLLRASVFITALLIVMQSFGYSISGILAFGGIGGLAVGFAAKDLLANFFGGAMIYLDRPFKVGDWIRSPDRNIEGTVEDIGWRLTRIRTFDKRPLYVPNQTFNQISLENPSRMLNRRIYETIGIRYDDANKMDSIVTQVKAMLENHNDIDQNQIIMVNFTEFAASSLNFFVYTFTKTTDWATFHVVKQDVLLKIIEIVEKNGAECAFPTQTLHMASLPEGFSPSQENN